MKECLSDLGNRKLCNSLSDMKLHAKMLAKTLDMKHGIEEHKNVFQIASKLEWLILISL